MRDRGRGEGLPAARPHALELLGAYTYWTNGGDVRIPPSACTVVAFVALQPGPVHRSILAGTIWPDVSDDRANGNLRSVLWRAKTSVPGLLACDDGTVAIAEDVDVDYRREAEWSRRLIHGHATDADLDRDLSPHALELLPGMYDDWIVFERERFNQRWLHAAERMAIELAHRGRHAEALDCALAVVASDPLRESAQRIVVQCHVIEHNVVEARRRQDAYARLLRTELGVEPSPAFMALA
jgi:DNA-binding SARP family transcriptional activator